ncbi:MAG: hypothetical protein EXR55_02810 [Dehalococcoidia bacterium]|nr:hypothetical protein [Dehalococcoidia bacterium]
MLQSIRLFSVAVADLEAATQHYQQLFGLQVMAAPRDTRFGFKSVTLGNSTEGFIELIQPVDAKRPLARFMRERA